MSATMSATEAQRPLSGPLSPRLLISGASTLLRFARSHEPDSEMLLHGVGQPAGPVWATAFVHHAGYWSHFEHRELCSAWPLPATNDCNVWARLAELQRVLIDAAPRAGDLFLQWSRKRKEFAHVGIVVAYHDVTGILPNGASYMECDTIEGNIDNRGHYPREGIHRHTRRIVAERGDRFIRWAEMGEPVMSRVYATPAELCRALMLRPAPRTLNGVLKAAA